MNFHSNQSDVYGLDNKVILEDEQEWLINSSLIAEIIDF